MLAGHTGWTSAEVLNTIEGNPGYPAVYHKNSVTTSHVHDGVLRENYRTPSEPPDFVCGSYAEYGEGNGCGTEFDLPSTARDTHRVLCGGTGDPTATDAVGCNNFYYSCYLNAKETHKPRDCGREYWLYTTHGWSRADCNSKYRNCFATSGQHVNGGTGNNALLPHGVGSGSTENPIVSPPPTPTPTPPPSPTYHACGEHETSVSGDHSLQASCSLTDSNGNYCTVTNFYACDSHTHSYPTPPPTPTPTPTPPPEPTPTPPPPSPTLCPANAWTGCGSTTSHATTCGGGHTYYTCNPSAVSWHQTSRTCKRSSCGASYTNCTRGDGTCSGGDYIWHKK